MQILHPVTMDMVRKLPMTPIRAVQNDANSRAVAASLLENGSPWVIPGNITAAVAFRKGDGSRGLYDRLPDGSTAITINGSTVTAILAPQVLSCPGGVDAAIVFFDGSLNRVAAFPFSIDVDSDPSAGQGISNDYYRFSTMEQVSDALEDFLAKAEEGIGGYILTEADKQEIAEQAAQMVEIPQEAGITDAEKNLILSLFRNAAYTSADMGNTLAQLEELWSGSDEPIIPDEPDEPHTHSYTSSVTTAATCTTAGVKTYTCGCGHSYTQAIPATGHSYVDGVCTVCGAADPSYNPEKPTYTITNHLTNCASNNSTASIVEGGSYSATLTAEEGFELDSVTVTMGGVDITASAYAYGVVNIASVTGDVIIAATAVEIAVEDLGWESGTPYVIDEFTENYYLTSAGKEEAYNGWKISEYLPCKSVDMFTGVPLNTLPYCLCYNGNKEVICGIIQHNGNTDKFGTNNFTVTNNAEYMRLSMSNNDWKNTTVTPYAVEEVSGTTVMEPGEIYAIKEWENGALIEVNGTVSAYGGWFVSGFIPCSGHTKAYLSVGYRKNVCFYDASKNFISSINTDVFTNFEIPGTATYMRISMWFALTKTSAHPVLITVED